MIDDPFLSFETWLRHEFQSKNTVTQTQQFLRRKFRFDGDLAELFTMRIKACESPFYSLHVEAYKLEGQPEISFLPV